MVESVSGLPQDRDGAKAGLERPMQIYRTLATLWRDRRGQDMIEYALVAGMITLSAGFVAPSYIVVPVKALMSVVISHIGVPNPT